MESVLPTKLGQAPTDTPRTLASNRRRLGSLFASMTISNSDSATDPASFGKGSWIDHGTPSKGSKASPSGWLSWLSPTKQRYNVPDPGEGGDENRSGPSQQGGHSLDVDAQSLKGSINLELGAARTFETKKEGLDFGQHCALYSLPDELLIEILIRLPLSPNQISALSLVSRRFQALSQSPQLWSLLFNSTSGFEILPELARRLIATDVPPRGQWNGTLWIASEPETSQRGHSIPVHYPTLYRSRTALSRIIRCESPGDPPHRLTLGAHMDSVYCVHLSTPWLITGSRDRSILFWRLPDLPLPPGQPMSLKTSPAKTFERVHDGSVLSVDFEMGSSGHRGVMVTGSSDMTACVWEVEIEGEVAMNKVATLRGHTGGVLDVALSPTRIATCSKDNSIRIYDKITHSHLFTFDKHEGPINCLSLGPQESGRREQVVSASGDGFWIIWDMITGKEVRRGAGDGRGLACVAWKGDQIITGDNDRMVKIFSSVNSNLLKTFEGHTDLVRSVAMDRRHDIIISGSYDQSVRMWDVHSGDMIRRLRGDHTSLIFGVATDRGRVVSISHDSTVQVYTYGQSLPYRALFA